MNRFKYVITILLSFTLVTQSVFAGPSPEIVGQSGFLMERTTGAILYQKNANIQMYPASTTKVLTSVLCLENLDPINPMTKTDQAILNVPSDSSHIGLRVGDIFPIYDAIHAVMLGSDNYVSYDLATLLDGSIEGFADRMNAKARQIGATSSHFVNPHGYHDPDHYTTAHDLALIMDYAYDNKLFAKIMRSPKYALKRLNDPDHPIEFPSTVKLIDPESPYYRSYTVGGKTGFTRAAGRSLVAVASQDGMELIGVVLKSDANTFFEDMNTLFDYGFDNFALEVTGDDVFLKNNTFSPWAKDIVTFALEHELITHSPQNYSSPISKQGFVELLMRTVYIAQNKHLEGFDPLLSFDQAIGWDLIHNTSLLSGFNDPLTRETAADMVTKLLESVGYRPNKLFPTHYYEDLDLASSDYVPAIYYLQETGIMGSYKGGYFYPHEHLTVEQGLSVARQLYKLYASSPYSYLHKTQKTATN